MLLLPANLKQALIVQLNLERLNAAYYDALATWCEFVTFDKSGVFFRNEAVNELSHYQKISAYLIDRNEAPILSELPKPIAALTNLISAYQAAAQREALTTQALDELYDLAEETGDNATCQFLLWFIEEQVKSEREYYDFIQQLQRVGTGLGEQWFDEELVTT